ncbi:hypothetical protein [Sphingomonas hengshuiensis]|uniref:Uncharacterized protein n=1 Tax=Sphingomonas hengshuiensis TaxID=1609977 RepID=A0A7U4J726_9SPHN|nr:hypothetical protein [Sphingomonas hengshuiensis]AJP71332.1 hypothetical protein TS85_05360 [Sphingomonas hengshuiensis]
MIVALAAAAVLASCGPEKDKKSRAVSGTDREEAYCNIDDLPPSKRHSFVVIDAVAMKPSSSPEEFREQNGFIRELLLSVVGPDRGLPSGMIAPRERVSLIVLPADGSAGRLIFTGCVPGLTIDEQAKVLAGTSGWEKWTSGDPLAEVTNAGGKFTESLLAAIFASAGELDGAGKSTGGPFASSALVQSLAASQQLLEPAEGSARRIFLVSDLSRFRYDGPEAGQEGAEASKMSPEAGKKGPEANESPKFRGIASAKQVGQVLRFSEVYLVQPPGSALKEKEYLGGFILGQGAKLAYFGSSVPTVATRPPVQSLEFAGRVEYDAGPESVQMVVARDDRNNLVYSFFALLGSNASVTPMSGTMICETDEDCKIISDKSGFAQQWKSSSDAAKEFKPEMPLAGARDFEFTIKGETLKGEVKDEEVQLSSDPAKPALSVSATQQ